MRFRVISTAVLGCTFLSSSAWAQSLPSTTVDITKTTLVSANVAGVPGNSNSITQNIAAGSDRYVVFASSASNLVTGDTNGRADTFIKDLLTKKIVRASTGSSGQQGNLSSGSGTVPIGDYSAAPGISSNGSIAVFTSNASNFSSQAFNGKLNVYAKNIETGVISAVSTKSNGVFGNGDSYFGDISSTGRYVIFISVSTNLVAGGTNGSQQIFVKDLLLNTTKLISSNAAGEQANSDSWYPSVTNTGRYVAFVSSATNLVPGLTTGQNVYIKDIVTGGIKGFVPQQDTFLAENTPMIARSWGYLYARISADGTSVAYNTEQNDYAGVSVYKISTGARTVVIGNTSWWMPLLGISTTGKYVSYSYTESNYQVRAYVQNITTGASQMVCVDYKNNPISSNNDCWGPTLSGDGKYVAFASDAKGMVPTTTTGINVYITPNKTY